eukprot:PhF_6_TR35069/c0_g1_i1/m.51106
MTKVKPVKEIIDPRTVEDAAAHGDLVYLRKLVAGCGGSPSIDVLLQGNTVTPAFHLAASHGRTEILEFFLQRNLDPNMINDKGHTALHCACAAGQVEAVKLLLKYSADPYVLNTDFVSPLEIARTEKHEMIVHVITSQNIPLRTNYDSIFSAAAACDIGWIKETLKQKGNEGNTQLNQTAPQSEDSLLHVVMRSKTIEESEKIKFIRWITSQPKFTLINHVNAESDTPLSIVARMGSVNLVRALLQHGAVPSHATIECSGDNHDVKALVRYPVVTSEYKALLEKRNLPREEEDLEKFKEELRNARSLMLSAEADVEAVPK